MARISANKSYSNLVLDRDGVINELIHKGKELVSPRSIADIIFESGIDGFMQVLKNNKISVIVVTNQPDISRGLISESEVQTIHMYIQSKFPIISNIYHCPHTSSDRCTCRKPSGELISRAIKAHGFKASETLVVGDSWVDIEAGMRSGCDTALIQRQHSWAPRSQGLPKESLRPTYNVRNIMDLIPLLQEHRPESNCFQLP